MQINKCKYCNCNCHCSVQNHSNIYGICPCQWCHCIQRKPTWASKSSVTPSVRALKYFLELPCSRVHVFICCRYSAGEHLNTLFICSPSIRIVRMNDYFFFISFKHIKSSSFNSIAGIIIFTFSSIIYFFL